MPRYSQVKLLCFAGLVNASFCPAVSGCREVVIANGRIALDFDNPWQQPTISVAVPSQKTLILVSYISHM